MTATQVMMPIPYEEAYESLEEEEDETERALVKTLLEISDTTFADSGLGLRSVHAKSHALLRGELRVLELPLPFAQGLFSVPKTYPVAIRISTSPGDLLDDRVSTPRGFALKVTGVEGERLPDSERATTQDFLLVDGPAFLAPTAKKFVGSLKLLAATTDRIPRLKRAFSALLRGTEKALEAVGSESGTIKGMGGHPATNPLGETYFSQVPFLYGLHMAKWQVAPVSTELQALKDAPVDLDDKPDGLREALNAHLAAHGAEWELRVQLCTDIEAMPIEDASVPWPEDRSPFVPVARITVPPQPAWSDALSAEMDDGLSFSPWHGLAAHRPLGSINRVRRATYSSSAGARSSRGRCPVHEP
ncbi:MAG: catalase family protein [Rhizobiales bacterium]|nr:catalase family protein [Rhizobacter sp.]